MIMTTPTATPLSILASIAHPQIGLSVTFSDGSSFGLKPSDTLFEQATALLAERNVEELVNLLDPARLIKDFVASSSNGGSIKFENGMVTSNNGLVVPDFMITYIKSLIVKKMDVVPVLNFVERLQKNPSYTAQQELGLWIITAGMTITEDGCFLAYKKVNPDYTSIHDNKTMNEVGKTIVMPGGRAAVDDNRRNLCSTGLHFCSPSYLPHFGRNTPEGCKVLLLKVDPADVVSIPADYNNAKGRAVQYHILKDVTGMYFAGETTKVFDNYSVISWDEIGVDFEIDGDYGDDNDDDSDMN